ncbi:MAG TPA: glycoside hydrolase family 3 C-terminal domain-containing protein, partial [Fimbriimonadaceae bacterium]|nr:glycoside hydrolase family 3 C-terminal domain-containing protein [Fimbriimonadaceae bacterium]
IQGVQSQGVVATVKHFAANNHEEDRGIDSSEVDERTLRELYFRPFEAAIKEGGALCVMCAYNKINGTYCSQNEFLLNEVLKKDWGFKGFVVSDYGATHSTLPALLAGLDVEMPGGYNFNRAKIEPLVQSGQLPVPVLDDKVRRILRVIYTMGWDRRSQTDSTIPRDVPANEAVALQIAREGTVLLKNRDHLLPIFLPPKVGAYIGRKKTILVVGPNAFPAVTGGGGSSYTDPVEKTSLLDAVRAQAGSAYKVVYRPLVMTTSEKAFQFDGFYLPDDPAKKGLFQEHWNNETLSGTPDEAKPVAKVDLAADDDHAAQHFSMRWTAIARFPGTGRYMAWSNSDDGIRVWVDGKLIINDWNNHGSRLDSAPFDAVAGHDYQVKIEYFQGSGASYAQFGFGPREIDFSRELPVREIKAAYAVIASVGFNPNLESEGLDRPFALPDPQEQLLEHLVKLNPRTIVVNNSGAGVDMSRWAEGAGAILQAWYPGGIGSRAIAEILFGKTNPSGKLPTSFPKTLTGTYYEHAYPPVNHQIFYREGLFMGYRWFDANGVAPLFPFGFGLSYTSFSLSDPEIRRDGGAVHVGVWLKNTGRRAGAETVQVYASIPTNTGAPKSPVRELKAFKRVELAAGARQRVGLDVRLSDLATFDVKGHRWVLWPGRYTLEIGTSSRDLPLHREFRIASRKVLAP